MTYDQATRLSNEYTKHYRRYYTAVYAEKARGK